MGAGTPFWEASRLSDNEHKRNTHTGSGPKTTLTRLGESPHISSVSESVGCGTTPFVDRVVTGKGFGA